jgi:hypothetical protein
MYRRYTLSIRCARCCESFQEENELEIHHRQPHSCELKQQEREEGINKEQEKIMRRRQKSTLSEEAKWKELFKIIFPDDDEDMMPSPCQYPLLSIMYSPNIF